MYFRHDCASYGQAASVVAMGSHGHCPCEKVSYHSLSIYIYVFYIYHIYHVANTDCVVVLTHMATWPSSVLEPAVKHCEQVLRPSIEKHEVANERLL